MVTVLVDNQLYSFHEQDFSLVWRSPELSPGDHFVRIIHESGESINLDYIVILDETISAASYAYIRSSLNQSNDY